MRRVRLAVAAVLISASVSAADVSASWYPTMQMTAGTGWPTLLFVHGVEGDRWLDRIS